MLLEAVTTMAIAIKPYGPSLLDEWNQVLDHSINGTFLHRREFMEYHGDRFEDASLVIYHGDIPVAIFPAEKEGNRVHSHRGLTYGGWLLVQNLDKDKVIGIVSETVKWYKEKSIKEIKVRMVPDFFATDSQQILKDVLDKFGFELDFVAVHHCTRLPFTIKNKGKKWGRNKAKASGLIIEESDRWQFFWERVLIPNLWDKHKVVPTHSWAEIINLKSKFPHYIKLYAVSQGDEMLGGAVVFLTKTTAHLQYVAATTFGKSLKCLDYLMSYMIEEVYLQKSFFNMGVSHIPSSLEINEGLVQWKKTLGGEEFEQRMLKYAF